jgi:hypothetical protein
LKKNPLIMLALALTAIAALMLTAAPIPTANAGLDKHADDPCRYTRHLEQDNPDFALWEAFCDDTVEALHLRHLNADAECLRAVRTSGPNVVRFCRRHCKVCPSLPACRRIPKHAKDLVRKGKFEIGKCTWDACMDYDAIYDNARAQLEEAGYSCLVQKLYVKYQYVKQHSVRFKRHHNHQLGLLLHECFCAG